MGAGCVGIWSSMGHAEEDSQAAVNTNMSWLLRGWWDPIDTTMWLGMLLAEEELYRVEWDTR